MTQCTTPQFSIVIPTYNRALTIGTTLTACQAQTCQDFEIIVVDDGSTDDTARAIADIEEPRLVLVQQANAGPAAARNRGVIEARGRFIAFLDSDDVWQPQYLARVADELAGLPQGEHLVYSRLIVDRGVGRYWNKPHRGMEAHEAIYDYLYVHGGFIQTSTLVLPAAQARQIAWDERVTFGDNDQFVIDCWHAGLQFHYIDRAMTRYEDALRADALSQLPVHDQASDRYLNFFSWMSVQRPAMSPAARTAFAARYESVLLARQAPMQSLKLVFGAWRVGALSTAGALRQLIQNFAPRQYRRLTDLYVRWRGLSWAQAAD